MIPDPNFFYPGSRTQGQKIPDPVSESASKNFSILTRKIVSELSEILSRMFILDTLQILDPDLDFLPIPDPGFKKAPDPGSGSATLSGGPWTLTIET
jgi:hypothetical protein